MDTVPEKISFPNTEEEVLHLWDHLDAFHTSLKKSEGRPEYNFYDGPPFATGLPHYGHLLAGTIKDTVTRYAHQTGHHVTRRFGWDCHGLPIEFEIDKELGIRTREDVLKMGIPKYNAHCRAIVMRYSSEWEKVVKRLGRWIDFQNDYKTMDMNYMESLWYVFKQIFEQGLVYKGFKVMPYSTGCTTPISNFEANLAYKEVSDPAVVIAFPLEESPEVLLLAWTTTPWTLPSNLALCVNPDFVYLKAIDKETGRTYVFCETRSSELYKSADQFTILEKIKGKDLAGKRYLPLFNYFEKERERGAFQVLVDGYVTADSGTGIVHCAPAFGEDDFRVCSAAGIVQKGEDIVCPVDDNGNFTSEVTDFAGMYVKNADKSIMHHLKEKKKLVRQGTIHHNYPFCWRSDTPLLYRAVPSWFIAVEKIKDRLVANNKKSYWVPEYVQEKRFHNWLAEARDWAISRNRYWGTPIPIWTSEDGKEIVVIGSVAELEQLSGVKINDLHRESIDQISLPGKTGVLKRIDEVFDCWFESGSMPYAQRHYPFENKDSFEKSFPADFIAEGIDQTRGWFYTLLVIGTILFDQPPFKNLIANGLVLAADGKKMSKRLKNYPDPVKVIHEYGADALRLYLINSPVVRAESLKFQEQGVRDVIKDVFLPWFNAYRFFVEVVTKYNKSGPQFKPDRSIALQSTNIMDKWVLAATNSLIEFVRKEMEAYRLYTVVPRLVKFIEQLTNWYVRLNRKRLKGSDGQTDCRVALSTLFEVIYTITKAMSPFTPFLTEYFYQNLRKILPESEREDSVHYMMFPDTVKEALNQEIEEAVSGMQTVIQLGRAARDRKTLPLKFPLTRITVIHQDEKFLQNIERLQGYILSELNIKEITRTSDTSSVVTTATGNSGILGKRLRKDFPAVDKKIQKLSHEEIKTLQKTGQINIDGHEVSATEVIITPKFNGDITKHEAAGEGDVIIVLDLEVDEKMREEGSAREVINRIQRLRKKAGIHPTDPIEVFYQVEETSELGKVIANQREFIMNGVGVGIAPVTSKPQTAVDILSETFELAKCNLGLSICRLAFAFSSTMNTKSKTDSFFQDLQTYILTRDYFTLLAQFRKHGGAIEVKLNGQAIKLELGKDVFESACSLKE